MNIHPEESFAVFVDDPNFHLTSRGLGFEIDYRKLLEFMASQGHLVPAYYCTAWVDDREYSPLRPLIDWLDYNGYAVVTKLAKEFTDANGRRNRKKARALPRHMTATEVERLILATPDLRHRAAFIAAYGAGLRVSETVSVKVGDIKADRKCLHIPSGKGGAERMAPLPDGVIHYMRSYRKRPTAPEPSPNSPTPSSRPSTATPPANAETTSLPQDTTVNDRKVL